MIRRPAVARGLEVPELGPSLGRTADAPRRVRPGPPHEAILSPILDAARLELATSLFELGARARSLASSDPPAALATLGRAPWLEAWERAVAAVAGGIAAELDRRLQGAGIEAGMPRRRIAGLALSPAERRTIAARLGAGGAMLVAALDELEDIALRLRLPGWLEVEGGAEWRDAVRRAAGKTEAAWTALEEAAHDEWSRWLAEVERIRAWRRPRWPLWLVTFAVLGLAGYLGLVLGGVIPAPDPLDPLVEAWWRRLG